jgi:uncharacterized protein (DUF1330 family)|tara:strand:+ start:317 stop:610 length:294 start_codon:yes stop_codon:yes gene_type:complete
MPKGYWISAYQEIKDTEALAAYAKLAGPSLSAAGGTFLARGMPTATKEAGKMQRLVIIEFENITKALAAYDSPGYKKALEALGSNAVIRDMRIIEGV